MYKRNTSHWFKHWDFILLDFILIEAAFYVAYVVRNGDLTLQMDTFMRSIFIVLGLIDLVMGFLMETYRGILRRGYWLEAKAVARHVLVVCAGVIVYLFVIKESAHSSRLAMFYFPLIAWSFLFIGRCILKMWLRSHRGPAAGKRGIMLVGSKKNYEELLNNFTDNPYSEFKVTGIGIVDEEGERREFHGLPVIYGVDQIAEYLKTAWTDEVMFSIPNEIPLPEKLIDECGIMGLTVHLKLARLKKEKTRQMVEEIEGYTVISSSINMASQKQVFVKRLMDIAGGIVGLIGTAVIFVIVAPCIFVKSPGPIFFSQIRVGKNGRKFKIYKFRSMYMDAEERKKELMAQNNIKDGMMFKMDNDPRIIKGIGNFIRDFSLDEFPQFWNVLKGDMSLVGTRPPTEDEWEKYDLHHRARLAIKPGITGMWQISGRSDITDFEEVVRLDTEYIKNWDLGLDIKILLKTVLVVIGKDGAK